MSDPPRPAPTRTTVPCFAPGARLPVAFTRRPSPESARSARHRGSCCRGESPRLEECPARGNRTPPPRRRGPPGDREGREEGRHRKDRRVAHLPPVGSPPRHELGTHREAGLGVVPPPAGEARQGRVVPVPLVDEASPHGAWPCVEVFVG